MLGQTINTIKIHPTTQSALTEYVRRIAEYEKGNLLKVFLFGSVARGEANIDSDVDVLVVLKNRTMKDFRAICSICADVEGDMNFDGNAYLQPIAISEKEAEGIEFFELMNNVSREGVALYGS